MHRYDRLRNEARNAAECRGHVLSKFEKFVHGRVYHSTHMHIVGIAYCILYNSKNHQCRQWVQIDTNPQPNGIDIGGPAVAVNCKCKVAA